MIKVGEIKVVEIPMVVVEEKYRPVIHVTYQLRRLTRARVIPGEKTPARWTAKPLLPPSDECNWCELCDPDCYYEKSYAQHHKLDTEEEHTEAAFARRRCHSCKINNCEMACWQYQTHRLHWIF